MTLLRCAPGVCGYHLNAGKPQLDEADSGGPVRGMVRCLGEAA